MVVAFPTACLGRQMREKRSKIQGQGLAYKSVLFLLDGLRRAPEWLWARLA
jgi:hypothetical protein